MDGAGRVVLPKPLRQKLALSAGDTLELESTGEEITLRPARTNSRLSKEKGVWVFRTGKPLSASQTNEVIKSGREIRDLDRRRH